MPALADHRSEIRDALARRLCDEFTTFPSEAVHRCVADVQACMAHLGLDATPARVERMAREHLTGILKSEPPSGRAPAGGVDG
ncbi:MULTISPECIES: hypothetical protein [Actinomadura]|uniref:Uncharacterized protein n=1 Tax=Actinomadura madurae TaxID=1993 RepID=A0A1I5VVI3_9ACTN|nr:hypothetical protein [Actinomadura madurae]MCP9949447.1 hypothetical protein [Actinomadura madurae]MCP9966197.1 hypothetical protein [Actinomadura madurae]MCP9978689.1 hypothetical protein [Actinomadura madurae]MCQ0009788.1 hypothetical protein [Actinomadura madurae]MCQ0014887.1 hypothetical protein [Actinomadura madurae]